MNSKLEHRQGLIRGLDAISKSLFIQKFPSWYSDRRSRGIARFMDLGIPTSRDEEWKYTNIAPFASQSYELGQGGTLPDASLFKDYAPEGEIRIVYVNGIFSDKFSQTGKLPAGLSIVELNRAAAEDNPAFYQLWTRYDIDRESAFVALNEALTDTGSYLRIEDNTVIKNIIHIVHITVPGRNNTITLPRTAVTMGKSSEATIVESHLGIDDHQNYVTNALTDIELAANATLHYCKAQKEGLGALHIGHTRVWQERDSNFDGFALIAGAKLTRNDLDVILNGEGSEAHLNALYSVFDDQHVDNHTSVDHRVPNCRSNQLYKGILNHNARAVFNGKIFVRPIAQQTNSYQLNKNLLLGKGCRVDTKPQLEIYADDVKCTHGATIGQLDEDEMFYLQTRCIPRKLATKLLVHGFADDLFAIIQNEAVRQKVNWLMQPSFEAFE